jgi:hypothetical protein
MMRGLKLLLKVVGILLAIPVAIVAIWLAIGAVSVHFKTEDKITAALEGGFPGAEISINGREDFEPANQICFDLTVRPKSPGPARRAFVMVGGDSDGGTWPLRAERFRSMQDCENNFSRG